MTGNSDLTMLNDASSKGRVDDVAPNENTVRSATLIKVNIDKCAEFQHLTPNLAAFDNLILSGLGEVLNPESC